MKKFLAILLVAAMTLSIVSVASAEYVIRIYSNSNSVERTTWLKEQAAKAGFTISIDDNDVISGDAQAVQAANENKDADLIFGLNETRWSQLINGEYENLVIMDWKPTWGDKVGAYKYEGKAYGLVIQNVLMLYRTDELGTNGTPLHFEHWADIVNCGYKWYRQGKVGGTTNMNINSAMLYPFVDPESPAGGISIEGWKTLWKYCMNGTFTGDSYGLDPLNRGEVQVSTFYSSSLFGKIDGFEQAGTYDNPLRGTWEPENWALVEIDDGTYYIAEYIGIVDRPGRTAEETETVKAFAEWFGSAETQIAWSEMFDSAPCNEDAASVIYEEYGMPAIYELKNFALEEIPGTGMKYYEYVAAHIKQWNNIMTNLGFYPKEDYTGSEPDWENLDWAILTQAAE